MGLVIIFESQVGDELFAAQVAQRVLELHQLDEQVVFRVEGRCAHGAFEIEGEPFLDDLARHLAAALRQVHEQNQVEHDRRRQDRVAAQKVNLDLHRVAEPAEDIEVVPAFLVVTARRVVVDTHLVVEVAVELGVELGCKMYSSADSLLSSLVLKEAGSSSTSPSRLPRMLVENQPRRPSSRALRPGAIIVFIKVWPVLKSLPQIGAPRSTESCWRAGISTVRFGAPLAKGTPSFSAA